MEEREAGGGCRRAAKAPGRPEFPPSISPYIHNLVIREPPQPSDSHCRRFHWPPFPALLFLSLPSPFFSILALPLLKHICHVNSEPIRSDIGTYRTYHWPTSTRSSSNSNFLGYKDMNIHIYRKGRERALLSRLVGFSSILCSVHVNPKGYDFLVFRKFGHCRSCFN